MGFKLKRLRKQFKGIEKIARPIIKPVQKLLEPIVKSVPIVGGIYSGVQSIARPMLQAKREATTAGRRARHEMERRVAQEEAVEAEIMGQIPRGPYGVPVRNMGFSRGEMRTRGGSSFVEQARMNPDLLRGSMVRGSVFNPITGRGGRMSQQMTPASFVQMRRRLSPEPSPQPAPLARQYFSSGRFFR